MIWRTVVAGVLVLLLLLAGLPGAIGFYLASQADRLTGHVVAGNTLRVASIGFQRGWFQSSAVVRLRSTGAGCTPASCAAITVYATIFQGPLPWVHDSDGQPALMIVVAHADPAGLVAGLWPAARFRPALKPVQARIKVRFDTRSRVELSWPGAHTQLSQPGSTARINAAPLHLRARLAPVGSVPERADLRWPGLAIDPSSGGHFGWQELVGHYAGHAGTPVRSRLSAKSLTMDDGHGDAGRLSAPRLILNGQPDAPGRVSGDLRLLADRVALPAQSDGALDIRMHWQHVNGAAWRALPQTLERIDPGPDGLLNSVVLYHDVLPGLLDGGASLAVEPFRLATLAGPVAGHLRISAPATLRPVTMGSDVLSQLAIDARLRLPTPELRRLVAHQLAGEDGAQAIRPEDIDAGVTRLVQRQLVMPVPDAPAYSSTLTLQQGRLTLNGLGQPGWQSLVDQLQAAARGL